MEDAFYWVVFTCFCMPVVALVWNQGVGSLVEDTPASRAFRNNYLLVYCFQMREYVKQCPMPSDLHMSYS